MKLAIGTRVYDVRYGWGEVSKNQHNYYVVFETAGLNYSERGTKIGDTIQLLSLTEYSLEKGGFTAIDSEPTLEVGEMAYFWDDKDCKDLLYSQLIYASESMFKTYNKGMIYKNASREIHQWFLEKFKK